MLIKDQRRKDNTLWAWNAICRADGVEWDQLLEALLAPNGTHRDDKNRWRRRRRRRGGEDDGDKGEGVGLFLSNTHFRMYIYRLIETQTSSLVEVCESVGGGFVQKGGSLLTNTSARCTMQ